jgi:hypothetical protein
MFSIHFPLILQSLQLICGTTSNFQNFFPLQQLHRSFSTCTYMHVLANTDSLNLHNMSEKWTSDVQLLAFSTWHFLNSFSSYNNARTKDASNTPKQYTCEHKTKRANSENFKHWIAESQNPKWKITRRYSNILDNVFCKVK